MDTNTELATVGLSNVISGNCWDRRIGIILAIVECVVLVSTVNILQVTPLFFLGATLIFIGFDLMFEWLVEIRHKFLVREYIILVSTFIAIQVLGIDFGIVVGIILAIVD